MVRISKFGGQPPYKPPRNDSDDDTDIDDSEDESGEGIAGEIPFNLPMSGRQMKRLKLRASQRKEMTLAEARSRRSFRESTFERLQALAAPPTTSMATSSSTQQQPPPEMNSLMDVVQLLPDSNQVIIQVPSHVTAGIKDYLSGLGTSNPAAASTPASASGFSVPDLPRPQDFKCPVCFNHFTGDRKMMSTKCGHIFCRECLIRSLNQSPECPKCRTRLPSRRRDKADAMHEVFLPDPADD